jgi:hypothetical protein
MNKRAITLISITCFLGGAIFYAIHKGWLIFNLPCNTLHDQKNTTTAHSPIQKKITLFFWHNESWQKESTQLVWTDHQGQNTLYVVNSWLCLLDDEKITHKKVSLQAAMLNPTGSELYLSFDRSLFFKQETTYTKWMLIEGLLKTLRENGIRPQSVRFLVNHEPMQDNHLDFINSWPIGGFIE